MMEHWMSSPRVTLLVLREGRDALTLEVPLGWSGTLLALLMVPLLMGAAARRCLDGRPSTGFTLRASEVMGSLHAFEPTVIDAARQGVFSPRRREGGASEERAAVGVAGVKRSPAPDYGLRAFASQSTDALGKSWLRLQALHLGEGLRVQPFDDAGRPQSQAFDAVRHLMRCRITGEEVPIDPRLVRILVQLNEHYDRPIQLVSGHRTPYVIGTRPTSQHAAGRAADIRIAGVSIEALRSAAMALGARGVGLYPEKDFVHVDVRDKPKYFWVYSEQDGEEADMRAAGATASVLGLGLQRGAKLALSAAP
jgi:uncharacterized protein YcbK (DUF882 family)